MAHLIDLAIYKRTRQSADHYMDVNIDGDWITWSCGQCGRTVTTNRVTDETRFVRHGDMHIHHVYQ